MTVTKRWPVNRESYSYSNLIAYLYALLFFPEWRYILYSWHLTPPPLRSLGFLHNIVRVFDRLDILAPLPIQNPTCPLVIMARTSWTVLWGVSFGRALGDSGWSLPISFLLTDWNCRPVFSYYSMSWLISVHSHNRSGNIVYHTVYQMNMELQNRWPIMLVNKLPMGHAGFGNFIKY